MKRTRTALVTLLAVVGLVLALDYATFAATGDSLVLGKANSSARTTTLTTTGNGPALSLRTRRGRPPLSVSSNGRVLRLNADSVDGRHASELANSTRRYTLPASAAKYDGADRFVLPPVARGTHLVTLNTALIPDFETSLQCILKAGGREYGGQLTPYNGGFAAVMSSAAVVDVRSASDRITVTCSGQGGTEFTFFSPLVVTVTDTAVLSNRPITAD